MRDRVHQQPVFFVIHAVCAVADFAGNARRELAAERGFRRPAQVAADSESTDVAFRGEVKLVAQIVATAQADVGIEPIVGPRHGAIQRVVEPLFDLRLSLSERAFDFRDRRRESRGRIGIEWGHRQCGVSALDRLERRSDP